MTITVTVKNIIWKINNEDDPKTRNMTQDDLKLPITYVFKSDFPEDLSKEEIESEVGSMLEDYYKHKLDSYDCEVYEED